MSSRAVQHVCSGCSYSAPRWFGRCPSCGAWSSATEARPGAPALRVASLASAVSEEKRLPTGSEELDRVLGGGMVAGGVLLLAGEPGIGKSTLVLQVMQGLMARGQRCLLVSGEESLAQTGLRAARVGVSLDDLRAAASTSLRAVLGAAAAERPDVLVVDSIQSLKDEALEHAAGSTLQVRECASALVRFAKDTGVAVILVGHVTKDGSVAGPKTLEHVVDAVVALEGDRSGSMRLVRAAKNRFGPCDETGVFTMTARGLEAVPDPSAMLLADRSAGVTGSTVFPLVEGTRPVLTEIQALVTATKLPQPRRVAIGVDARRVTLLLGVLSEKIDRLGASLAARDVFVAAAGGFAVKEPAADLALCLALLSGLTGVPVPGDVVAIGEVGLTGEIRRSPAIDRRLTESARLGFATAIVPRRASSRRSDIAVVPVDDVADASRAVTRIQSAPRARVHSLPC
jgi:DNA repair protein RadA/Sms